MFARGFVEAWNNLLYITFSRILHALECFRSVYRGDISL